MLLPASTSVRLGDRPATAAVDDYSSRCGPSRTRLCNAGQPSLPSPTHQRESLVPEPAAWYPSSWRAWLTGPTSRPTSICARGGRHSAPIRDRPRGYAPPHEVRPSPATPSELRAANVVLASNHDRFTAAPLRGIDASHPQVVIVRQPTRSAPANVWRRSRPLAGVTVNMHLKDVRSRACRTSGVRCRGRPLGCGTLPLADAVARRSADAAAPSFSRATPRARASKIHRREAAAPD